MIGAVYGLNTAISEIAQRVGASQVSTMGTLPSGTKKGPVVPGRKDPEQTGKTQQARQADELRKTLIRRHLLGDVQL